MEVSLSPQEHIEHMNGRLQLVVSPEYTFGTDALLLAAFAMPKPNDRSCDFGTGCGIIPFFWLSKGVKEAYAVEIQKNAVRLAERSAALSGVEDRLHLFHADLRSLDGLLPAGRFDCVTMNPPYTRSGHGIKSRSEAEKTARHENSLTLADAAQSAKKLLKFGGRFCICLRPDRLPEAVCTLRAAGLEPKRLRFAAYAQGKTPWLFLLEGQKGRNPGMKIEPELYIRTQTGAYSDEMQDILQPYGKD